MSAKIFYQEDCNLSLLDGKTIAITKFKLLMLFFAGRRGVSQSKCPLG